MNQNMSILYMILLDFIKSTLLEMPWSPYLELSFGLKYWNVAQT